MRCILLVLICTYASPLIAACDLSTFEYRATALDIDGVSHLKLLLPEETDTMQNPTATFILGKTQVPMYEGYLEDGWLFFEPSIPKELVNDAQIKVLYTFKPTIASDGTESFTPCVHETVIEWKKVPKKSRD